MQWCQFCIASWLYSSSPQVTHLSAENADSDSQSMPQHCSHTDPQSHCNSRCQSGQCKCAFAAPCSTGPYPGLWTGTPHLLGGTPVPSMECICLLAGALSYARACHNKNCEHLDTHPACRSPVRHGHRIESFVPPKTLWSWVGLCLQHDFTSDK